MVVWVAGKNCDPVNTCHSEAFRDCLGCKNAIYALYFTMAVIQSGDSVLKVV